MFCFPSHVFRKEGERNDYKTYFINAAMLLKFYRIRQSADSDYSTTPSTLHTRLKLHVVHCGPGPTSPTTQKCRKYGQIKNRGATQKFASYILALVAAVKRALKLANGLARTSN